MNRQVVIKAEQVARMIVKGIPLSRIAVEMGMSYDGLRRITMQPEYLKIEAAVRNQVTSKMDARLAKRADMEEEVDDCVPEALQILLDGVRQKRDMRAALELLDRDPNRQFAKGPGARPLNPNPSIVPGLSSDILSAAVKHADATARQVTNSREAAQPSAEITDTLKAASAAKESYDA